MPSAGFSLTKRPGWYSGALGPRSDDTKEVLADPVRGDLGGFQGGPKTGRTSTKTKPRRLLKLQPLAWDDLRRHPKRSKTRASKKTKVSIHYETYMTLWNKWSKSQITDVSIDDKSGPFMVVGFSFHLEWFYITVDDGNSRGTNTLSHRTCDTKPSSERFLYCSSLKDITTLQCEPTTPVLERAPFQTTTPLMRICLTAFHSFE